MKYGYVVMIFWSNYDDQGDFCVCENETDAQEMILSLGEGTPYDNYISVLECNAKARPEHFFHDEMDTIDVGYKKIAIL